jgi:hypothetical protein
MPSPLFYVFYLPFFDNPSRTALQFAVVGSLYPVRILVHLAQRHFSQEPSICQESRDPDRN